MTFDSSASRISALDVAVEVGERLDLGHLVDGDLDVVCVLDLPDDPEVIDPDQPLFGRGLELDSLDTLEIVSLIDEEYDIALDDTPDAFGSISKIVDQILAKRD